MSVDVLDWPMMVLGSVGAEFEVIAPPELHTRLQEWSERFGRASLKIGDEVGDMALLHPDPQP